MICDRCGATCPQEQRNAFARACWLATHAGESLPDCEDFCERYWRGEFRRARRCTTVARPQVKYGRS